MMVATVAFLGTCATKLEELLYLRDQILQTDSTDVIFIDAGRSYIENKAINLSQVQLISQYGGGKNFPEHDAPRSETINFMTACALKAVMELYENGDIHAIIAAGGSGNTSIASAVMRALPIGFPKMIVSTVASGITGPIVGETDISLVYSVVDVAGLNEMLRDILSNAGASIAGAAAAYARRRKQQIQSARSNGDEKEKKRAGITMFGVTTPGVDTIRHYFESKYDMEIYVFHATGHGGKAMERLVREGRLDAVIDITTTEICDLITGGVFPADSTRLEAAVEAGIPNIISLGATDMTNFCAKSTVPEKYRDRLLYKHNPLVTLMRPSEDESSKIGEFICGKLRKAKVPEMIELWNPKGEVSMIPMPGGPFEDRKTDTVLFQTVIDGLKGSGIEVIKDERDINHEGFARDIPEALVRKMRLRGR